MHLAEQFLEHIKTVRPMLDIFGYSSVIDKKLFYADELNFEAQSLAGGHAALLQQMQALVDDSALIVHDVPLLTVRANRRS